MIQQSGDSYVWRLLWWVLSPKKWWRSKPIFAIAILAVNGSPQSMTAFKYSKIIAIYFTSSGTACFASHDTLNKPWFNIRSTSQTMVLNKNYSIVPTLGKHHRYIEPTTICSIPGQHRQQYALLGSNRLVFFQQWTFWDYLSRICNRKCNQWYRAIFGRHISIILISCPNGPTLVPNLNTQI